MWIPEHGVAPLDYLVALMSSPIIFLIINPNTLHKILKNINTLCCILWTKTDNEFLFYLDIL